jgi:hypothetical protein
MCRPLRCAFSLTNGGREEMQFGRIYGISLIVLGILLCVQFVRYPCTNCARIQRFHAMRASFDKEGRTVSKVDPTNYLAVPRDAAVQTLSRLTSR